MGCGAATKANVSPDAEPTANEPRAAADATHAKKAPLATAGANPGAAPTATTQPVSQPVTVQNWPPPDVTPPVKGVAKPDDGKWVAWEAAGSPRGYPLMFKTVLHPDGTKHFTYVAIVAVRTADVFTKLVEGTLEPESKAIPKEQRSGKVPEGDWPKLIAVHNGGFMASHGRYGMRIGSREFLPPRLDKDPCAIGWNQDGSIRIAPWSMLAPEAAALTAYRQTPPCLLSAGEVSKEMSREGSTRRWGAAKGGDLWVRRSAIGLDASGEVMFYAFGDWTSATTLTRALKAAGVAHAAQLDMNWSFIKFLLFKPGPDGSPVEGEFLEPEVRHSPGEHIQRHSQRDFFYWVRR